MEWREVESLCCLRDQTDSFTNLASNDIDQNRLEWAGPNILIGCGAAPVGLIGSYLINEAIVHYFGLDANTE